MTVQLRIYAINRSRLDDFVAAWRKGVYPLRLAHGFSIPSAWVNRERNEFIWLLTWDGPGTFAEADAAYYASTERASVDPDPRQFIAQANQYTLESVALDGDAHG